MSILAVSHAIWVDLAYAQGIAVVIEDAARCWHALQRPADRLDRGGRRPQRCGLFQLYATKNLTTSEEGLLHRMKNCSTK
jgi:hypothetical protein